MSDRGLRAEALAAAFLQQQGLVLLERNYRCRYGEIDLVMVDGKTLVFVEVRMRISSQFGGAAASITASKRRKLASAARHYLTGNSRPPACRFDALLVNGADKKVVWLKNIFDEC